MKETKNPKPLDKHREKTPKGSRRAILEARPGADVQIYITCVLPSLVSTKIRFFNVKVKVSDERIDDIEGEWLEANFKNTPNFSAVAYSFAKYLNQVLDIPFGIINSPKDGSVAEAWISPDVLKKITTNKELSYYAKQPHNNPSVLFNGMINAIIPFTIKYGIRIYKIESLIK